jgi:hypothetical protein
LWNDAEGRTFTMRSKEEAHDYRYFLSLICAAEIGPGLDRRNENESPGTARTSHEPVHGGVRAFCGRCLLLTSAGFSGLF